MSEQDAAVSRDRRSFIRCSACGFVGLAALAIPGCAGGGEAGSPTDPVKTIPRDTTTTRTDTSTTTTGGTKGVKFEIVGSEVRVFLSRVPELATSPSAFIIEQAQMIILRTGAQIYSALSAVCTHEGCTVNGLTDNRLVCPCHGSTYDFSGTVVVGPATSPLAKFNTSFDSAKNELVIQKTS
jgi:Rieske Fe-S protein